MTFVAAAIGAAGLVGGALISSNASKSAANTQAQSANDASKAQTDIFNTQVGLQEPWRQAGIAGLGKLNTLLGLAPAPSSGGTFSPTASTGGLMFPGGTTNGGQLVQDAFGNYHPMPAGFDEQAYLAANPDVAQYISEHPPGSVGATTPLQHYLTFGMQEGRPMGAPAGSGTTPTTGPNAPDFGALTKTFTNSDGSPGHEFTMADYQADPGYQFRLDQGQKGLERAASASGGVGSGKFLKDAMTYNQGQASQEYGNAFARFNTSQNDAFNRFNTDQTNTFNRLAALSGIGQTSANTLTTAAGTLGGQIGSNIIGAGNALAAGQVGSANALNGAIGQGISLYQQNQLLSRFPAYGTGYGGGVTPPNPYYTG